MVIAAFAALCASYTISPLHGARELAARRLQQRLFMCDGEEGVPDSLDLLRMPQISTPERESFKAYRERQRERKHKSAAPPPTEAELMRAEMERVPLGPGAVLTVDTPQAGQRACARPEAQGCSLGAHARGPRGPGAPHALAHLAHPAHLGSTGMEPVMGEPRDLREPEWRPPTSEETRATEEEFEKMLGGPAQRYKATLEKVDELGIGDDIDRLLSP